MDYTQHKKLVEAAKPQVFKSIDDLFEVSDVPPPNIAFGTPKELDLPISEKEGSYMESKQLIVLNPQKMALMVKARLKGNMRVNPNENIIRIFAKEYATHVHSFLHGFTLLDKINGMLVEFMQNPLLALHEAMGLVGMFEAYRVLRHKDAFPALARRIVREEAQHPVHMYRILAAAFAIANELESPANRAQFRSLARQDLEAAYQQTVPILERAGIHL